MPEWRHGGNRIISVARIFIISYFGCGYKHLWIPVFKIIIIIIFNGSSTIIIQKRHCRLIDGPSQSLFYTVLILLFTIRILTAFSCNIWLRVLHLHHSVYYVYFLWTVRSGNQKEPGSSQQWQEGLYNFPIYVFLLCHFRQLIFFHFYFSFFLSFRTQFSSLLRSMVLCYCRFCCRFYIYTFFTIRSLNFRRKKK